MTNQEVEAIVGGYHGDPFRVLGPHAIRKKNKPPTWEVRAFLPQASAAEVVLDGATVIMAKQHPEGFFAASMDGERAAYRLRATLADGSVIEFDDPYSFPPLLSGFELHLHGEGTHSQTYNMLGSHLVECKGVRGVRFAVWAPNAEMVTVTGEFNDWDVRRHPMRQRSGGVWELFIPGLG
jgi:1,4-alpha-glucan branching enzyme